MAGLECYVYMILCKNGTYYTGSTSDWEWRWKQHAKGDGAAYIKANGFDRPVYLKEYANRSEAMKEEYRIKQLPREKKKLLIKQSDKFCISIKQLNT